MATKEQKNALVAYLEEKMQVRLIFQWEKFMYFQYIGSSFLRGAAAYIAGAKAKAGIPSEELQVLVEYPTSERRRKFAFHGHRMAADMLSKMYGGAVSLELYWILYNEKNITGNQPYGYAPGLYSVDEIEPRLICEQVNNLLKGIGRPVLQNANVQN